MGAKSIREDWNSSRKLVVIKELKYARFRMYFNLIISWLERRFLVKTFEGLGEDENLEQSIQEIGELLNEKESE